MSEVSLSTGRYVTCDNCTWAASQYCGLRASTSLLFTCQSFSMNAPLLTSLPGLVQSWPYLSSAALFTGPKFVFDIRSGRNGTGYGVLLSTVYGSSALTPRVVSGFLPATMSVPLSRNMP